MVSDAYDRRGTERAEKSLVRFDLESLCIDQFAGLPDLQSILSGRKAVGRAGVAGVGGRIPDVDPGVVTVEL